MARDPRKVSLYLSRDVLDQIAHEAQRQDRSMSWIVRQAWQIARGRIKELPSAHIPAASESEAEGD